MSVLLKKGGKLTFEMLAFEFFFRNFVVIKNK